MLLEILLHNKIMFNLVRRKKKIQAKRGFTLVEIMVSVAIFSIVVTAGMGALMSMLGAYKFSQKQKKSADNVNYFLENMTREIRLGYNYYILADKDTPPSSGSTQNGSQEINGTGSLIGFEASDNRGYMIYYLNDGILKRRLFYDKQDRSKYVDVALSDESQVFIKKAYIMVMHTEKDDKKQPLVWLRFATLTPDSDSLRIVQTLISQRNLDI